MSQPGYHPICVLFQGNDCAFDGTYRLVCRHQVRQTDFKPGDNVEVDMGDDDDRDETTHQEDDIQVINEDSDGRRWRDAIALGDEMVMSLLRNMCKNQPAGKSPWGSNNREAKRRKDPDGQGDVPIRCKRIKTEECTTSQEQSSMVDNHKSRKFVEGILSTLQNIQASQDHVASEIEIMQQNQQQLSHQVAAIQNTLCHLEENSKVVEVTSDQSESDILATPVSLYCSQSLGNSSLGRGVACSGLVQPSQSTVASTSSSRESQGIISSPVSQAQSDLSSFSAQDANKPSIPTLPPLYPIETSYSHPQVLYSFRYTDATETKIYLGYINSPLTLTKNEMEDVLFKTNTPAAFAYRLAGKIFTKEELLTSNTSGKGNKKTGKTFKQLNVKFVNIILMEVETRFPTCRSTRESTKRLFAAINERCRNERKKLIYRSDGKNDSSIMITNPRSITK